MSQEFVDDSMYPAAKQYIELGGQISVATLQRTLKIGYNRTLWLFKRLESEGVIEKISEKYGVPLYRRATRNTEAVQK